MGRKWGRVTWRAPYRPCSSCSGHRPALGSPGSALYLALTPTSLSSGGTQQRDKHWLEGDKRAGSGGRKGAGLQGFKDPQGGESH
jgi:hypothetical protein